MEISSALREWQKSVILSVCVSVAMFSSLVIIVVCLVVFTQFAPSRVRRRTILYHAGTMHCGHAYHSDRTLPRGKTPAFYTDWLACGVCQKRTVLYLGSGNLRSMLDSHTVHTQPSRAFLPVLLTNEPAHRLLFASCLEELPSFLRALRPSTIPSL